MTPREEINAEIADLVAMDDRPQAAIVGPMFALRLAYELCPRVGGTQEGLDAFFVWLGKLVSGKKVEIMTIGGILPLSLDTEMQGFVVG